MNLKPIYKRLSAFLLCFALLVGMLPVTAGAATAGGFEVTGGTSGTDYSYSAGVLTILTNTPLTISNTNPSTATSDRIVIGSDVNANITLNGVNIQAPVQTSAIDVPAEASLTLTLANNSQNTLTTASTSNANSYSGIHVPENASLTIQCANTLSNNHQCNDDCGKLSVKGSEGPNNGYGGAGIGGNGSASSTENSGTIRILGGQVTINGGTSAYGGAGIGGGAGASGGDCGAVYITGGQVTITGGTSNGSSTGVGGAGIGGGIGTGGNGGDGGTVVITGGNVEVIGGSGGSSTGSRGGAGIGGGNGNTVMGLINGNGGDGGTVVILTTEVTVTGGSGNSVSGVAIGGGTASNGGSSGDEGEGVKPDSNGNYTVYGGNVTLPNPPDTYTIPDGATLTIPSGSTLTVPSGTELVVDGTLKVETGGSLSNSGTVSGGGSLTGSGTVTNNGNGSISVSDNDFAANVSLSITSGGSTVSSAAYGSTVTLTATVTGGSGTNATDGSVTFYQGTNTSGTPLNSGGTNVSNGTATYDLALSGTNWTPNTYTITAVYTPASGSGLLSGSGTGSLTVSKASQETAPAAPSGASTVSANSITLNTVTSSGGYGDIQYGYTTDIETSVPENRWQTNTTFGGLAAGTAHTFYTRYAGNNFYEPSPASSGTTIYTAYATPIGPEGYSINYADETVTAETDYEVKLSNSDTWTASGTALSISPNGTFQVRCAATLDGPSASEPNTVTLDSRPNAPALTIDTTAEGVTISSDYYYSFTSEQYDNNDWTQGDNSLVHVDPEDTIYIYAAATTTAFKSAVQSLEAPARGTAPNLPTINYGTEALSGTNTGMEYGIAMGQSVPSQWKDCSADMSLEDIGWTGGEMTVYFRTAATDDSYASASTAEALTIPARPGAPAVQGVNETVRGREDGKITGLTAGTTYEISDDNGWSWEDADLTGTEITGLTPGSYQVRVKSTDTSFTGEPASVTISTGAEPTYTLNVTAPTFDSVYPGYAQPEAKAITISSAGNSDAIISSVTVDNASFVIGGSGSTVLAGGSISTWTIQPAAGLSAGTYTATITLAYNDGATATAQVSFTVRNHYIPPQPTGPSTGGSKGWEDIQQELEDAKDGETVTIKMNGETEVPGEMWETIAGRDVTVILDMGENVSWTVDGNDVPTGATFGNMDFGVDLGTSGISVDVINAITGEVSSVQITLAHDGEFGFILTLTAPLGWENAGHWANLYHYDEDDETLNYETSGEIQEDGTAALRMTHASQYAILIDKQSHELPFTDLGEGQWYESAVRYAYLNGIMEGMSDAIFQPNGTLSRAMAVQILYNLEGQPDISDENLGYPYSDVDADSWYGNAVYWARITGVATGYGDGTFHPTDSITRQEFAQMLYNYASFKGDDLIEKGDLSAFPDNGNIAGWAETAMSWANGNGLINGHENGLIDPTGTATRAQAASILMKFDLNVVK